MASRHKFCFDLSSFVSSRDLSPTWNLNSQPTSTGNWGLDDDNDDDDDDEDADDDNNDVDNVIE